MSRALELAPLLTLGEIARALRQPPMSPGSSARVGSSNRISLVAWKDAGDRQGLLLTARRTIELLWRSPGCRGLAMPV